MPYYPPSPKSINIRISMEVKLIVIFFIEKSRQNNTRLRLALHNPHTKLHYRLMQPKLNVSPVHSLKGIACRCT